MESLTLQQGGSIIGSGDAVGQIQFAAPSESDAGASRYIVGQIYAQAEGAFNSVSNPASLVFSTSAADNLPASGKLKVSHEGHFLPLQDNTYDLGAPDLRFRHLYAADAVISPTGELSYLYFDTTVGDVDQVAGQLNWNSEAGTIDLGLTDDLTIHLGQSVLFRVKNSTGSTITKGQAVYASGVLGGGQVIQVAPFAADESVDEVRFIGLMTDDLANGEDGFVNHFGHIKNVDLRTSNTVLNPNGETWNIGDILFVDDTSPGGLTKVQPKDDIYVALVLADGQNGELFVRITDPGHINDLHDVDTSGLVDNNFLVWNSGNEVWEPSSGLYYVDDKLGVGVESPTRTLDVQGSMSIHSTSIPTMEIGFPGAGGQAYVGYTASNQTLNFSAFDGSHWDNIRYKAGSSFAGNHYFYTSSTTSPDVAILKSGRVGISTIGPDQRLHVNDGNIKIENSINPTIEFDDASYVRSKAYYDTSSETFILQHTDADANQLVLTSGNDVGIGTNAPNATLHVYSATSGDNVFNVEGTNGSLFGVTDNLSGVLMSVNTIAGLPVLEVNSDYSVTAGRFNQNDFVISSGGNVGIGTDSPVSKLDVSGVITATGGNSTEWNEAYDWVQNSGVDGSGSANHIAYWSDSNSITYDASQLYWDSSNNRLGIGTSTPSSTLQVDGSTLTIGGPNSTVNPYIYFYDSSVWMRRSSTRLDMNGGNGIRLFTNTNHIGLEPNSAYGVGVGTFSPAQKLHVKDGNLRIENTTPVIEFHDTAAVGADISFINDGLVLSHADVTGDNQLVIASNSGVGVGTDSPTATLHAYSPVPSSTVFNVEGTNGSLFSVVDNLSGVLMSVNNNAGLPVFEVYDDDSIIAGRFAQNDFVVSSGGDVGIGTGSPVSKLDVSGVITATGGDSDEWNQSYDWVSASGGLPFASGTGSAGHVAFWTDTNQLSYDNGQLYWDQSNNRLGVGTSSPSYPLDIAGGIGFAGNFVDTRAPNTSFIISGTTTSRNLGISTTSEGPRLNAAGTAADFGLHLSTNGNAYQVFLKNDGNVGINNSSPAYTLDVAGTANITGDVIVGGNVTVNGTTVSANVDTMEVSDPILTLGLASGNIVTNTNLDRGMALALNDGVMGFMGWDTSENEFSLLSSGVASNGSGNYAPGTYGDLHVGKLIVQDDDDTTFTNPGTISLKGNTDRPYISFHGDDGSRVGYLQINKNQGANIAVEVNEPLLFRTNGDIRMTIKEGGDVGIGTSLPSYKLDVNGTAGFSSTINAPNIGAGEDDSVVILDSDGKLRTDEIDSRVWGSTLADMDDIAYVSGLAVGASGVNGTGSSGQIAFWTGTNDIGGESNLYWDQSNDRLGVGTATPSETLHVVGTARVDNLKLDGNTLSATNTNGDIRIIPNGTGGFGAGINSSLGGNFAAIGGGCNNNASGNYATIGGGYGHAAVGNRSTISGGYCNRADGYLGTVGGGCCNSAYSSCSTISGGYKNFGCGSSSTVAGGEFNCAIGAYSSIAGGNTNTIQASGTWGFIGGGCSNLICGDTSSYSVIGGGFDNTITAEQAVVAGGRNNCANGLRSTVGGGYYNCTQEEYATIGGGANNTINALAYRSTIAGGSNNVASGSRSTIGGGCLNCAYGTLSVIGGGYSNVACNCSTVSGGYDNTATGALSTVSGGRSNCATGDRSTIGGGCLNCATNTFSTVGGGECNCSISLASTISGGRKHTSSGYYSTIGGGCCNIANGFGSTVAGGRQNTSSLYYSFVGGGRYNCAMCSYSAVVGGTLNVASGDYSAVVAGSGNIASGACSFIGGGCVNTATGGGSIVGGGAGNLAGGSYSVVSGGVGNYANNTYSTTSGGYSNLASGASSTIAGGHDNTASGACSTVGGGISNCSIGQHSSILGGVQNCACARSTVAGGHANWAITSDCYASIGGGYSNLATGGSSTIGGGYDNSATNWMSTVSGGYKNLASGACSTVSGGDNNCACGINSTIGGGKFNQISSGSCCATVAGGYANCATGAFSSVTGGMCNSATASYTHVGGGFCNVAVQNQSSVAAGYRNKSYGDSSFTGGGRYNCSCGTASVVTGGWCNSANTNYSVISGGKDNTISGQYSSIAAGQQNNVYCCYGFIGGGTLNVASGDYSAVVAGSGNVITGDCSFIAGGFSNSITNVRSTISGGAANTSTGYGSTIGGGASNQVTSTYTTIGGGTTNTVSGYAGVVGGGKSNKAMGTCSTVGGGQENCACGCYSTSGGGYRAKALGHYSTVSGGYSVTAGGGCSTVGGGRANSASGNYSTIGGGSVNNACGVLSTIGGGSSNTAIGSRSTISGGLSNQSPGEYSTVSGGRNNCASGDCSVVGAGRLNCSIGQYSVITGGECNEACQLYSTVAGGGLNRNYGYIGTIGGGFSNYISSVGSESLIAGGRSNSICGSNSTISGGRSQAISSTGNCSTIGGGYGNSITGSGSTIAGGKSNTLSGDYSFTAGYSNNDGGYANVHILGSGITATQADTTYTQNIIADGHLAATTKSFLINHPTRPGHKLQYGSLESPYHGVRLTGRDKITSGWCVVKLPEYICELVHDNEDVNIQLTNYRHGKVLYVSEVNIAHNEFTVKTDSWFGNDLEFYWSFTATRKDIDPLRVEY